MDYTITPQYHDKKGCYIYVVRLSDRVDKEDFATLSDLAKSHKGYYSSFRGVNGFVFKTEEIAEQFCEDMMVILDTIRSSSISSSPSTPTKEDSYTPLPSTPSGMELHKALRAVIQTEGEAIITEVRLVNILDDFKAFSVRKYLKNILRILIIENLLTVFSTQKKWRDNIDRVVEKVSQDYGWERGKVAFIFDCISYGLSYIKQLPFEENVYFSDNVKEDCNNISKSKPSKSVHLKFRDQEITGDPIRFTENLIGYGYEVDVWCDDFVTMKGPFAGVSNCKLWIHFDPSENVVYRVKVEFPWYQNRTRVVSDYQKLKKSLKDLYGAPKCEYEDYSQDWTATYNTPTGIIRLECFPGNCPQVTIDYYDGYYDTHHGEIIEDLAKLDL